MGKLKKYFRRLRDPRAANASYPLLEILFVALAAVLCGAKSCTDMSDFGRRKIDLLRRFVPLEKGVPSHDVFSDVFRILDAAAFERVFRDFVSAFAKFHGLDLTGVFAVDGKSLCGAYERGKSALPVHLVNVFAAKARVALASRKAPGRNESEAALEVLQMLRLKRKIVTADALFCSRAFAKAVLDREGNYVLALKKNQGKLFAEVNAALRARASETWLSSLRRQRTIAARSDGRPSCATSGLPSCTIFPASPPSPESRLGGGPRDTLQTSLLSDISFSPHTYRPRDCLRSSAPTGPSRTRCTGFSMSSLPKTPIALEKTPRPKISRCCAGSLSISFEPTQNQSRCAER